LPISAPPLHIHFVAIGGTGMAPLAAMLAGEGHRITGSDGPLYPPMSTLLAEAGIEPSVGFDPAHLEPLPDLVVIGNAVPRDNPEALATERSGVTRLSMPELLARFFLADRKPLVVCGTHGKTTTTALAAWVWSECGEDPGFLVGGVPLDLDSSFRRGGGPRFLIEGDEYNAAYFDRGAKFLHYRPESAILTSVEYDHADLYPSPESFREAFRRFAGLLPTGGRLIACGDSDEVRQVTGEARCEVQLYGERADCAWRIVGAVDGDSRGSRFTVQEPDGVQVELRLGLWGRHNVSNALAVWALARGDDLPAERVAGALASFRGVRRRQELVGEPGGIAVIDDFAHHPTAVGKTLEGLRHRYPGRRLIAAFEPRSLSAGRTFFLAGYREAFGVADRVVFAPVFHRHRLAPDELLDLEALAGDLAGDGTPTELAADIDDVEARLLAEARAGDVLITMSSGSFSGLAQRLERSIDRLEGVSKLG
jgi:UDP-N-acetylmuramate: L-alanyl-gamma-D-glutamyl-meso-diaminopimelate ligase